MDKYRIFDKTYARRIVGIEKGGNHDIVCGAGIRRLLRPGDTRFCKMKVIIFALCIIQGLFVLGMIFPQGRVVLWRPSIAAPLVVLALLLTVWGSG